MELFWNWIQSVHADKLDVDNREPLTTFEFPSSLIEGEYALYAPRGGLWNQLIFAILVQLLFQVAFAVVIYKGIVQTRAEKSSSMMTSYLLGYGVLMPLALYLPFEIMELLVVRNRSVKLAYGTLPTIVCFRCIEAMHGTSPPAVEASLVNYVTYYSSVTHFEWNVKSQERRKITLREIGGALWRVAYFFTACSLWLSWMMHVNYQPFGPKVPLDSFSLSLDLFSPEHLLNAYCLAVLVYFVLATGFEITVFGEQIKGYATKPTFNNPLFKSRSIREFWGKRWDLMIHRILKHGAFLPARKAFADAHVGNLMGTLAAFLASGLLHEYSWAVIFYQYREDEGECDNCYSPLPLKLTCFFLYNALTMTSKCVELVCCIFFGKISDSSSILWYYYYIISVEHYYGRHITFFESWPSIIVSTMLVLTAIPVSHWYSGDWVVGGFFDDFAIGLWHIKRIA